MVSFDVEKCSNLFKKKKFILDGDKNGSISSSTMVAPLGESQIKPEESKKSIYAVIFLFQVFKNHISDGNETEPIANSTTVTQSPEIAAVQTKPKNGKKCTHSVTYGIITNVSDIFFRCSTNPSS